MPRPLDELHAATDAFLVQRGGVSVPDRFEDTTVEYRYLTERVGVVDLGGEGVISVRGRDRRRFVDGVFATAGERPPSLRAGRVLLLTPDARVTADLTCVPTPEALLLVAPPTARGRLRRLLARHLVADEVRIEDRTSDFAVLTVHGPLAHAAIGAALRTDFTPLADGEVRLRDGWHVWRSRRGPVGGLDLLIPVASAARAYRALLAAADGLDGGAAGLAALETLRVESGQAVFGLDLDEGASLAQLGGHADVVDVARPGFLGRCGVRELAERPARHRLIGLAFAGTVPPVRGDELKVEGFTVGTIRAGCSSPRLGHAIALAVVEAAHAASGTELITADGETARVVELPFA